MSPPHDPKQNQLLAALPADDYARLLPDLELVAMPLGLAVHESGKHIEYVYFPTTSIVSLIYVMESGASAEIAITGNEGLVGIYLFMGGDSTPSQAVVQSAGYGYRLKASILKKEFALGSKLQLWGCVTRRRWSRRWRRPRCATGTIRWSSNSAAGCCCAWTVCRANK